MKSFIATIIVIIYHYSCINVLCRRFMACFVYSFSSNLVRTRYSLQHKISQTITIYVQIQIFYHKSWSHLYCGRCLVSWCISAPPNCQAYTWWLLPISPTWANTLTLLTLCCYSCIPMPKCLLVYWFANAFYCRMSIECIGVVPLLLHLWWRANNQIWPADCELCFHKRHFIVAYPTGWLMHQVLPTH